MRSLTRLAVKLAVLLILFPLVVRAAMSVFPEYFFDSEYGWYMQNRDCAADHKEPCRVMIMGDSAAKIACRPEVLSDDTYNLSVQGATAVEEYYFLRKYLENNEAPEYLIYMQGPWYFINDWYFWSRFVYFHWLDGDDLRDIQAQIRKTGDVESLDVSSVREFQKEAAFYSLYSPRKYGVLFLKGLILNLTGNSRRELIEENYAYAAASKGQGRPSEGQGYDRAAIYIDKDIFSPGELMDHYFRALIELCLENGIHFLFRSPPQDVNSKDAISSTWIDGYMDYMDGIQSDYPEISVDAEMDWYENKYFGDGWHLNQKGVEYYCPQLREQYAYIFEEKE